MAYKLLTVSNLEKVFPYVEPKTQSNGTTLAGEPFSFQVVAFAEDSSASGMILNVEADIPYELYKEGYVPATYTISTVNDGYILPQHGIFPEVLQPTDGSFNITVGRYVPFWIKANTDKAGDYTFKFKLTYNGEVFAETEYTLKVYSSTLADNDLILTNWMHYDGIAHQTETEVFSEEFYSATENYVKCAAEHGQTMLYIPMVTPALDTAVGTERLTVQAVGVTYIDGKYTFDFTNFDRIISIAQKYGIKYFELSHLFTQWGAEFCPKVVATTVDGVKKIFGWETSSEGKEYTEFLTAFLPSLQNHTDELGITDNCLLHLSDEPHETHLERYGRLKQTVKALAPKYKLIDALSDYGFYEKGYVEHPFVCLGAEKPFVENNADFWVYYCCGPHHSNYTNRFFIMPFLRVRILGIQLYLNNIKGFLHWGFNFYNSQYSKRQINPYYEADADGAFPAGDSFLVYPSKDGRVFSSTRLEALSNGINDYRALRALENKMGRDSVIKLLNDCGYKCNFTEYDTSDENYFALRNKINELLG